MVGVTGAGSGARPVYLKDVAAVTDGPGEVINYVRFSQGPAWGKQRQREAAGNAAATAVGARRPAFEQPAVTIALAKQKGADNVVVARDILARFEQVKGAVVPVDVTVAITRNYGVTADDKVNELVEGLVVGIVVVICLLTVGLGFTEALVVAVAGLSDKPERASYQVAAYLKAHRYRFCWCYSTC